MNVISGTTTTINTGYRPIFRGQVIIDPGATLQNNGHQFTLKETSNNGIRRV
ncbi:MAG: hypothetical protein IPL53_20200 [Ignavibacteria bacterium]|nr:hypothetical protein [Ignavibacteria bacterium]